MELRYDAEADALHLRLGDTPIAQSDEVRPGLILDLDSDDKIVGIEVLNASQRVAPAAIEAVKMR